MVRNKTMEYCTCDTLNHVILIVICNRRTMKPCSPEFLADLVKGMTEIIPEPRKYNNFSRKYPFVCGVEKQ